MSGLTEEQLRHIAREYSVSIEFVRQIANDRELVHEWMKNPNCSEYTAVDSIVQDKLAGYE